jgi:hypothetical protein
MVFARTVITIGDSIRAGFSNPILWCVARAGMRRSMESGHPILRFAIAPQRIHRQR